MTILSPILLVLLLAACFTLAGRRALLLWNALRTGRRPEGWSEDIPERAKRFLVYVLGQARMLRWPYAGILHVLIFYGFIALLTAILQAVLEAAFFNFRFDEVPGAGPIALLQDTFFVAVIVGVALALVQRFLVKPDRFRGSHRGDALLILAWIAGLVTAMELDYATKIAQKAPEAVAAWRPVASLISLPFAALGAQSAALTALHGGFFWLHLLLVFGFLVYLGHSKHLHIATAAPNVFYSSTKPKARLRPIDIEALAEASEQDPDLHFGVTKLAEFSQKDFLDWYTCTECGRCQAHCPAFNTGKPLSPKTLITDLRDHLYEDFAGGFAKTEHDAFSIQANPHVEPAATMWVTGHAAGPENLEQKHGLKGHFQPSWLGPDSVEQAVAGGDGSRPLFGGTINEETLWACTTCGACMDQCPVFIEHVPKIIDMRRALVLDEGRMPKQAESALRNIERVANPYGLNPDLRAEWVRELSVPLASDNPDAEYLYWMGCAASFDDRARTIASALVKILRAAGVSFAVLGSEERCTGDPARRIGNEYLFQERARENVETLNRHRARKVIAPCPHCFNTLANEYPDFGGNYEVIHHTQLIKQLLEEGRLKLTRPLNETLTYHDSCYLGRWNDVFAPPRDILERIPGLKLVEMAKSGRDAMCCGAGGGRMWMEEAKPRVNHARVQQAAATDASRVATACPFCLAMFDEGIAGQQLGEKLAVDDVAVYVANALDEQDRPAEPAPAPAG